MEYAFPRVTHRAPRRDGQQRKFGNKTKEQRPPSEYPCYNPSSAVQPQQCTEILQPQQWLEKKKGFQLWEKNKKANPSGKKKGSPRLERKKKDGGDLQRPATVWATWPENSTAGACGRSCPLVVGLGGCGWWAGGSWGCLSFCPSSPPASAPAEVGLPLLQIVRLECSREHSSQKILWRGRDVLCGGGGRWWR